MPSDLFDLFINIHGERIFVVYSCQNLFGFASEENAFECRINYLEDYEFDNLAYQLFLSIEECFDEAVDRLVSCISACKPFTKIKLLSKAEPFVDIAQSVSPR